MRLALSRFADQLRREGLRVSSGELIDAGRALESIDLADRDMLHAALRTTLAKRKDELSRFDATFDKFFAPPSYRPSARKKRRKRKGGDENIPSQTAAKTEAGRGGHRQEPRDPARGLRAQRRDTLRKLGERRQEPVKTSYPCPVIRAPHRPRLGTDLDRHDTDRRNGTTARSEWRAPSVTRKPFRHRWSNSESDALSREVARILARFKIRRTRRSRAGRRGTLWVQRIVRTNLGNDTVPFRLVRRQRIRKEPHLLLLVDISHSVARAAAVFLALAANLTRSFRGVRTYFFVNHAVDVSNHLPAFARIDGRLEFLDEIVAEFPDINPMALSDYGRVLFQISEAERRIRKDTVCIILGDARNNRFDPCAWSLEALRERARRVIWLVPEPRREWDRGDSVVREYARHCDAVCETADLEGLRFAMDRALRP